MHNVHYTLHIAHSTLQVHKILTKEDHPSGYLEVHDGEYLTRAQLARGQVHRLVSGLVQVHSVLEVHRTSGSPGSLILVSITYYEICLILLTRSHPSPTLLCNKSLL